MAKVNLSLQRPWIPYLILIITLTLTILSSYFLARTTYNEDQLRFLNAVHDTKDNISIRLETYIDLLSGVAGLYAADPDLTQQQYAAYISRLDLQKNYSGTQGIGIVQQVTQNESVQFEQEMQNMTGKPFTITPRGTRSSYAVVSFVTLNDRYTPQSVGYDMDTDPLRRSAMEQARDTGMPTVSGKVTLLVSKNGKTQTGFLLFVPVYSGGGVPKTVTQRRAKIVGFIYSTFQTVNLLVGILGDTTVPQLLNYKIYDGSKINNNALLQDSSINFGPSVAKYLPRFHETTQIDVASNVWTIVFSNHPQFDRESQKNLVPLLFAIGLFFSSIFFLLSRSQYIARKNAEIAAGNLKNSQKELKSAVSLRDNFISIASHELKTPVTSLKVYVEVLSRQFVKKGDDKSSDFLKKIIRQIDKLTLLIQDLLDVTKIQSNQMIFRKEKFNIMEMVREVVESTQQISNHHTIILQGYLTKNVWGDRERISQVLVNLLTNALKYSPKSDKVYVNVASDRQQAIISVQDFGIGINKEFQKKIFNRFYRISEKDEQTYPGLGIGLFISHEIIRRHGGEIIIVSQKGKGSTFTFTLPYKRVKERKS